MKKISDILPQYGLRKFSHVLFGQWTLWLILIASYFAYENLSLDAMYRGEKAETVSLAGLFLSTSLLENKILFEVAKWVYFVSAVLWFFNRFLPYSSWVCTLSFTTVMGLYFENIPFSDHQGIMINVLMLIYCLWPHFHHRALRQAMKDGTYWRSALFPNWVHFLSVVYIASYYSLSGMAKVLGSGFGWADGVTLQLILYKSGAPLDQFPMDWVMGSTAIAQALQMSTLMLELSFVLIIFSKVYRVIAGLSICAFHVVNGIIFSDVDFGLNVVVVLCVCVVHPTYHLSFWPWNWGGTEADDVPAPGLATSRWEQWFVWSFCIALFVLPLRYLELHPFSILPMYNYRLDHYVSYKAYDPKGRELSRTQLGLNRSSKGSNWVHAKSGRVHPSVNIIGRPPAEDAEVKAMVRKRMKKRYPKLPYVDVWARVYGAKGDGEIGRVQEKRYRVHR